MTNFPDSPFIGQQFTDGDQTWEWDGVAWVSIQITVPNQTAPNDLVDAEPLDPYSGANFPQNPALNEEYTYQTTTWIWDGTAWIIKSNNPDDRYVNRAGDTMTGPLYMVNTFFNMEGDLNRNIWFRNGTGAADALFQHIAGVKRFAMYYYDDGQNEREVAYFEDQNNELNFGTSVVTRFKGDNRYLQLTGGALTGPLIGQLVIDPLDNTLQLLQLRARDTDELVDIETLPSDGLVTSGGWRIRFLNTDLGYVQLRHKDVELIRFAEDGDVSLLGSSGLLVTGPTGIVSNGLVRVRSNSNPDIQFQNAAGVAHSQLFLDRSLATVDRAGVLKINLRDPDGSDARTVATFEDTILKGGALNNDSSVITREHGDARYLQFNAGNQTLRTTLILDNSIDNTLTGLQLRARSTDQIQEISFRKNDGSVTDRWDIRVQHNVGNPFLAFRPNGVTSASFFASGFASFAGAMQSVGVVNIGGDTQQRTDANPSISFRSAAGVVQSLLYLNRASADADRPGHMSINMYDPDGTDARVIARFEDTIDKGGTMATAFSVVTREHGDERYGQSFTQVGNAQTVFTGNMDTLFGPNASSTYFFNSTATNGPVAGINGTLLVQTHPTNGNFATQIVVEDVASNPRMWWRARESGAWGAWVQAGTGSGGGSPTGTVTAFAGSSAPTGWLLCDGAEVSRVTYADLFAVVGEIYGAGDGSTTFLLPDLRAEFIRGLDAGRGVDAARALGSAQAAAMLNHTHSGTTSSDGSHQHSIDPPSTNTNSAGAHTHPDPSGVEGYVLFDASGGTGGFVPTGTTNVSGTTSIPSAGAHTHSVNIAPFNSAAAGDHTHTLTTGNPSAGGGDETRPRNIAMNYIIKT